ncbi:unnamed protein product, partial [Meganyctiphanes norvegica]
MKKWTRRKVYPFLHRKRIRHKIDDEYQTTKPWLCKVLKKSCHPISKSSSQIECTISNSREFSCHISKSNGRLQTSGIIRLAAQVNPPNKCWSCYSEENRPMQVLGSVLAKINRRQRNNFLVNSSFKPLHCLITCLFLLLITKPMCVRCWENPMEGMGEIDVLQIEDILPEDARTYNKMMPPR